MTDKNDAATTLEEEVQSPDVHFEPIVSLAPVEVKTYEEDEDAIFKMRAKLFRFAKESGEWKERGTGEVRLLKHKDSTKIRILMRRDKTLKICANHYITEDMKLTPNVGSDRSWVWNVALDTADGENGPETGPQTLAIRFANSDNAEQFKKAFEDAQTHNKSLKSGGAAKEEEEKDEAKEEKKDEEKKEEKSE